LPDNAPVNVVAYTFDHGNDEVPSERVFDAFGVILLELIVPTVIFGVPAKFEAVPVTLPVKVDDVEFEKVVTPEIAPLFSVTPPTWLDVVVPVVILPDVAKEPDVVLLLLLIVVPPLRAPDMVRVDTLDTAVLLSVTPPIVFEVALELEMLPLPDITNTFELAVVLKKTQDWFELYKYVDPADASWSVPEAPMER